MSCGPTLNRCGCSKALLECLKETQVLRQVSFLSFQRRKIFRGPMLPKSCKSRRGSGRSPPSTTPTAYRNGRSRWNQRKDNPRPLTATERLPLWSGRQLPWSLIDPSLQDGGYVESLSSP